MGRWSAQETELLSQLRKRLGKVLTECPQYPEVVGDRKLLRFLRGHEYNLDKASEMVIKFLNWRKENNVDAIRESIVNGGIDHPSKFPLGVKILTLIPQVVLATDAFDCMGAPICVEQYNFSPSKVLTEISIPQYIEFVTYCLEYKMLITEQLSEEREQEFLRLNAHQDLEALPPYGVMVNTCVIRDLGAVGFEHIGSKGQEIIKAVISVASDNYPELMRKCYMINTPWLFNTLWYFIKGLLAPRTIAKVAVMGTSYKDEIIKEIDIKSLPKMVGGEYSGSGIEYVPFAFNKDYLNKPFVAIDVDTTTSI